MSRESKSKKLNFKQQIVYDYIRSYIRERGYAPSVREICVETGIQSTSGVFHYLNQLEHLGFIRRDPDKPRSIIVLKPCFKTGKQESIVFIPFLSGIPKAGNPLVKENVSQYFPVDASLIKRRGRTCMVMLTNDVLKDLGYLRGDRLLIDMDEPPEDGALCLIRTETSAMIRQVFHIEKGLLVKCGGHAKEDIVMEMPDILGTVTAMIRSTISRV